MTKTEQLKMELIGKINSIENIDTLLEVNVAVSHISSKENILSTPDANSIMGKLEQEIKKQRLISDDDSKETDKKFFN